ncbi:MAG: NAD(P)-dependent oxidoreductase [Peptoniphilus sp.]|nr:NAD(P)-dependent oxidoreductase [Peptoniphilus sp.]MDD7363104.1 NAD(P)-dependent oxidoreductase [Bacillota bacterium]MDY6044374.1 NAD(P)-dependent oxidoreductase [Peptoniphilus sp.]
MVDTTDKKGLVIGGGHSARIKIVNLLDSECLLYCMAETFCSEIEALADTYPDRLFLKVRSVDESFRFFAYDFLVLATGDKALEETLIRRAKLSSIPVLSTTLKDASDFHLASHIERGPLVLSVSTGNPTMTRYIKDDLRAWSERYNIQKMEQMNAIRRHMVDKHSPNIAAVMRQLWTEERIRKDDWEDRIEDSGRNERKPTGEDSSETSD